MKRIVSLALAIMMLIPSISFGAAPQPNEVVQDNTPKADMLFFKSTLEMIKQKYPFEVDEDALIRAGVKGMLRELDPNSDYYTREEAEMFRVLTQGEVVGIGIVMEYREEGYIVIKEVLSGNSAEKAGLKKGDIIVSIDDEPVLGKTLDEVSAAIKGKKGTNLKMTVKRGEEFKDFNVQRQSIVINPVHTKVLEGNIGYISIDEFSQNLSKHLEKSLKELEEQKINKIILDLRSNPGGLLDEAVNVAGLLLPDGVVTHIRYKDRLETIKSGNGNKKYELVVLVDGGTASASEIVAGAIQDRKLGTIIGTQTYGKGTVQSLLPVNDGSLMKLTIAEYLTPNKRSINGIGITPEIVIENTIDEDLQLQKAIELLKK